MVITQETTFWCHNAQVKVQNKNMDVDICDLLTSATCNDIVPSGGFATGESLQESKNVAPDICNNDNILMNVEGNHENPGNSVTPPEKTVVDSPIVRNLRPRKRRLSNDGTDPDESDLNPKKKKRKDNLKELETIFEEPITQKDGRVLFLGGTKVRRCMTFNVTKKKLQSRKMKAKKVRMNAVVKNKCKTMVVLNQVEGEMTQLGIS